MRIEFLLSRSHRLCRFARRRNKGNKGNLHPPRRSHFCYFCYFCGTLLSHAESFYCPTVIGFAASLVEVIGFAASLVEEIKEIKEILLPARCEAISAISAISAGHYYLMRKVFIVPQSSALPLRSSKK